MKLDHIDMKYACLLPSIDILFNKKVRLHGFRAVVVVNQAQQRCSVIWLVRTEYAANAKSSSFGYLCWRRLFLAASIFF
jgi:hypothetical protein